MGLFNRKQKEPAPDWRIDAVATMELWRPIGGHFWYLSRDCVVTGHYKLEFWPRIGTEVRPQLQADYADNAGVIHNIAFSYAEAKAIMAEQP